MKICFLIALAISYGAAFPHKTEWIPLVGVSDVEVIRHPLHFMFKDETKLIHKRTAKERVFETITESITKTETKATTEPPFEINTTPTKKTTTTENPLELATSPTSFELTSTTLITTTEKPNELFISTSEEINELTTLTTEKPNELTTTKTKKTSELTSLTTENPIELITTKTITDESRILTTKKPIKKKLESITKTPTTTVPKQIKKGLLPTFSEAIGRRRRGKVTVGSFESKRTRPRQFSAFGYPRIQDRLKKSRRTRPQGSQSKVIGELKQNKSSSNPQSIAVSDIGSYENIRINSYNLTQNAETLKNTEEDSNSTDKQNTTNLNGTTDSTTSLIEDFITSSSSSIITEKFESNINAPAFESAVGNLSKVHDALILTQIDITTEKRTLDTYPIKGETSFLSTSSFKANSNESSTEIEEQTTAVENFTTESVTEYYESIDTDDNTTTLGTTNAEKYENKSSKTLTEQFENTEDSVTENDGTSESGTLFSKSPPSEKPEILN